MKKSITTVAAIIFAAVIALIFLSAPTAAFADDRPAEEYVTTVTAAPGFATAVWFAEGEDQWPAEGQSFQALKFQPEKVLDLAFIQAEAERLGCGFTVQGDLYVDDAVTAALVNGGKLYGPSNPKESWPGGKYETAYSTVFYTGACPVIEPTPEPTPTPTPTPEPTPTTTPAAEPIVPEEPASEPVAPATALAVQPAAPAVLASTGFNGAERSVLLGAGGIAVLCIGGLMVAHRVRSSRR